MGYALSNFEYVPALARRVLVVQQDVIQRRAILRALMLWGYETDAAASLAEASDRMIRQPDFLLIDHQLPDGTCVDLLRRLRRRDDPVAVAILLEADERWLPELPWFRPDAVFRKPLDMSCLHAWFRASTPKVVRWMETVAAPRRTSDRSTPIVGQAK